MAEPKMTGMAFEQRYHDDSGVEFGVYYRAESLPPRIEFKCINDVDFPIEQLDWLIACLQRIRAEHPARGVALPDGSRDA